MSLATIQTLVDDKLRSAMLGTLYSPAVRDRAIVQALLQYGTDSPRELVEEVTLVASTQQLNVPSDWEAGRSVLVAVEHPVGESPMSTVQATLGWFSGEPVIVLAEAMSGVTLAIHFTAPHADDATTVPAHHENAVACWAAAELCRQLATAKGHDREATIGAAASNGGSASGDLARRAKDWVVEYRTLLRLPDPAAQGATGGQAAGAVVSWGYTRPRGRFNSVWGA